ncbi:MAG: DUF5718 family protein [Ruminococcus sp.]
MKYNLKEAASFGVAGNFTGHLEQAGEASDFVNVKTAEENAPKAVFPTYIPKKSDCCPEFLNVFPFDSEKIIYPSGQDKVQIEPECAILFKAEWDKGKVKNLVPLLFGASNDCSIRREGAKKISLKKNWGASSKGFSQHPIALDSFDSKSIINDYRIASFLVRDGLVYTYGQDSAVRDYSYVYEKLTDWIIDKLNNQADAGPAENISLYLNGADCPEMILVSIGATRYTKFGESNFLRSGDHSVVILYPESKYSLSDIEKIVNDRSYDIEDISVLDQIVEDEN